MKNPATLRSLILTSSLVAAGMACGGPTPDAGATLDAAVQQTVSAQQTAGATPRLSSTPAAPTPTEPPPIDVTLQFPTDTPAPTQSPTSSLAQATATPTLGTAGLTTRPNGTPVHAFRVNAPPVIDGDVSELIPLSHVIDQASFGASNWSGAADNKADFAVAWDELNLYLALHVTDDVHAQIALGEQIFRGDSVELLLDADIQADYNSTELSADDFQIGFTPGENRAGGPDSYLWFPASKQGRPEGVAVAAFQDETGNGFYLEASVPWATFGVTPQAGSTFGFVLSVSDNDSPGTIEQQSMISTVHTRRLTNPTTWGTLILDP